MLRKSLTAVLLTGAIGLAGSAFAQGVAPNGGGIGGAIGGRDIIGTTPADNKILVPPGEYVVTGAVETAPGEFIVSRTMRGDGAIIETRRVSDADGHVVETTRVYPRGVIAYGYGYGGMTQGSSVNGSVGGAIGGYNINGTTPPDNAPLPPEWQTP